MYRALFISVQFSCSVVSNSLWPHGLQHARPPCPSPTPRVYPNSCPLSQWCHPTSSSSVIPFSSHLQSFPASGPFQMSQLFTSGGRSIGVSASASVLPMNTQDWFPLGWTGWISLQPKGPSRVFSNTAVQKHQFVSIIKIYFKLCSSSPRTLHEIMQYFSSLSMPMNHLDIVWKIQTPGPRSGWDQAFGIFPSHSGDSSDGGLLSTFRVTQIILTDLIMQFLENMSFSSFFSFLISFSFWNACQPHPIPQLSPVSMSWGQRGSEAHWGHCGFKESLDQMGRLWLQGRNAEMQTLFLPTSPRTSFLNSSLIPFVIVVFESLSRIPFFFFSFYSLFNDSSLDDISV